MARWAVTSQRARFVLIAATLASALVRAIWALSSDGILVPDEGAFSDLAAHIAADRDWREWSSGWGQSLYPQAYGLVEPAAWLIRLGIPALAATRLVAIAFFTASALLLIAMWSIIDRAGQRRGESTRPWWPPAAGMVLFLFLPSHLFWSSLALRDATVEFWSIVAAFGATLSLSRGSRCSTWLGLAALASGIVMSWPLRSGAAAILSLSFFVGALLPIRSARFAWGVAGTALLSILMAPTLGPGFVPSAANQPTAIASPSPTPTGIEPSPARVPDDTFPRTASPIPLPQADGTIATEVGGIPPTGDAFVIKAEELLENLAIQRAGRQEGAASALDVPNCLGAMTFADRMSCEATRLPEAFIAVAVRPLWPIDPFIGNSTAYRLATLENVVWLALAVATGALLARRRQLIPRLSVIALAYIATYLGTFAAVEGNLGTAFRHKSILVWPIVLLWLLAADRRAPGVSASKRKGATQESEAIASLPSIRSGD